MKILSQFLVLVALFFASWFAITNLGLVKEDELNKFGQENARKLGNLMIESIRKTHTQIEEREIVLLLDSIKRKICNAQGVQPDSIRLLLFRNNEINAFAFPGSIIVINSGLINYAANAEEVAGVLAHEIGHINKSHIERRLLKEVGLSMLFVLVGGSEGHQILTQIAHTLSATAFDREYETEADKFAVESMAKAHIDPEHLSNIMFRLSQDNRLPKELVWLTTHPDTKDRAAEILKERKKYDVRPEPVVNTPWEKIEKATE